MGLCVGKGLGFPPLRKEKIARMGHGALGYSNHGTALEAKGLNVGSCIRSGFLSALKQNESSAVFAFSVSLTLGTWFTWAAARREAPAWRCWRLPPSLPWAASRPPISEYGRTSIFR